MAHDELLSARIRLALGSLPEVEEKKMFGGVGFLVKGNMACGVYKNDLIVRVGPANHDRALAAAHTRVFDITGRPMAGWVMVEPEGCRSDTDLQAWVRQGLDFARSLPPKEK